MRISDWSSDVCSSDLTERDPRAYVHQQSSEGNGHPHRKDARPRRDRGDGHDLPCLLRKDAPRIRRSEEHTSELPSLMRISYAVFCLKKKQYHIPHNSNKT